MRCYICSLYLLEVQRENMSLVSVLKEGDLVFVNKPEAGKLGPMCPIKNSGVGIIVSVRPTRVFPGPRNEHLYEILFNGKIQDILKDNINKFDVDI